MLDAKKDFSKFPILAELLLAKKMFKLGIQLPNTGDDNQSCHILTVLFNGIERLTPLSANKIAR